MANRRRRRDDVRYRGIDDVRLDVYDPALQSPLAADDLVVRTSGDSRRVAAAVQAEARRLDPRVVVDRLTTMEAIVSRAVAPWRFSVWMFTLFARVRLRAGDRRSVQPGEPRRGAAPARVRGSRGARGAARGHPRARCCVAAAGRALAGVSIGLLAASAGARGIRSLLFGVGALDVTTYGAVIALVLAVVAAAAYLPARRAADVDPLTLLRRE